ncbi:hypothetical protein, partial [Stenotrophomonas maltophilia]|uniref:hypothetical protein n=1 Tax=Stenotrophomonas maltophilia TaxID=40324 RepID=UPI001952B93E
MSSSVLEDPPSEVLAELREGIGRRGIGWRSTDRWWGFVCYADDAGVDLAVLAANLDDGSSWYGIT